MMKFTTLKSLLFLACFALAPSVSAEKLAVIVHLDNAEELTEQDIRRVFLGKATTFPSGALAQAVNIVSTDPSYKEFARIVLNKTPSQLRAYWAKRVFTGKGRKPVTVQSWDELLNLVKSDDSYISYTESKRLEGGIRLVMFVE